MSYPNDMNRYEKQDLIMSIISWMLGILVLGIALMSLGSCRSVKYVPVVEKHTEYVSHTDSMIYRDTLEIREQTIIRMVDSATMAKYGIQLGRMESAWLIQSDRIQKQISELLKAKKDTIEKMDTIPMPYPVEVEVPAQLSWWQKTRLYLANVVLLALAVFIGWKIYRRKW